MERRLFEGKNHAELYARYRVVPPKDIIQRILDYLKEKYEGPLKIAVDVGCGSGQTSFLLADHFESVVASDVSESQIAFGKQAAKSKNVKNVNFERVKAAETISALDNSVQLITASQAFHWFDQEKFFEEAKRVLCPGGSVALFGYVEHYFNWERNPTKNEAIMAAYNEVFFEPPFGDLWAPRNKELLFRKYDSVKIPMQDFIREVDEVSSEYYWTLDELLGWLKSCSAYQAYCNIHGKTAGLRFIEEFKNKILAIVTDDLNEEERDNPDSMIRFLIKTPFFLLVARKL